MSINNPSLLFLPLLLLLLLLLDVTDGESPLATSGRSIVVANTSATNKTRTTTSRSTITTTKMMTSSTIKMTSLTTTATRNKKSTTTTTTTLPPNPEQMAHVIRMRQRCVRRCRQQRLAQCDCFDAPPPNIKIVLEKVDKETKRPVKQATGYFLASDNYTLSFSPPASPSALSSSPSPTSPVLSFHADSLPTSPSSMPPQLLHSPSPPPRPPPLPPSSSTGTSHAKPLVPVVYRNPTGAVVPASRQIPPPLQKGKSIGKNGIVQKKLLTSSSTTAAIPSNMTMTAYPQSSASLPSPPLHALSSSSASLNSPPIPALSSPSASLPSPPLHALSGSQPSLVWPTPPPPGVPLLITMEPLTRPWQIDVNTTPSPPDDALCRFLGICAATTTTPSSFESNMANSIILLLASTPASYATSTQQPPLWIATPPATPPRPPYPPSPPQTTPAPPPRSPPTFTFRLHHTSTTPLPLQTPEPPLENTVLKVYGKSASSADPALPFMIASVDQPQTPLSPSMRSVLTTLKQAIGDGGIATLTCPPCDGGRPCGGCVRLLWELCPESAAATAPRPYCSLECDGERKGGACRFLRAPPAAEAVAEPPTQTRPPLPLTPPSTPTPAPTTTTTRTPSATSATPMPVDFDLLPFKKLGALAAGKLAEKAAMGQFIFPKPDAAADPSAPAVKTFTFTYANGRGGVNQITSLLPNLPASQAVWRGGGGRLTISEDGEREDADAPFYDFMFDREQAKTQQPPQRSPRSSEPQTQELLRFRGSAPEMRTPEDDGGQVGADGEMLEEWKKRQLRPPLSFSL